MREWRVGDVETTREAKEAHGGQGREWRVHLDLCTYGPVGDALGL